MSDAYIETTILADLLLKPNSPKHARAKASLARYENTLLPVYSIKEWKAGPLKNFAYIHEKLVLTTSFADKIQAIAALAHLSYLKPTSMEALAAAGQKVKKQPRNYTALGSTDSENAAS